MAKFEVKIEASSADELRSELVKLLGELSGEDVGMAKGDTGIPNANEIALKIWANGSDNLKQFIRELLMGDRKMDSLLKTFNMNRQQFSGMLSSGGFARRLIRGNPEIFRFDNATDRYEFVSAELEDAFRQVVETADARSADHERNAARYRATLGRVKA